MVKQTDLPGKPGRPARKLPTRWGTESLSSQTPRVVLLCLRRQWARMVSGKMSAECPLPQPHFHLIPGCARSQVIVQEDGQRETILSVGLLKDSNAAAIQRGHQPDVELGSYRE